MAIGTVVGFSGTPGSAQNANVAATLPTITVDGYAGMLVGNNVLTTLTTPTGWTLLAGPIDNGANNQRVWLFGKAVTSADSGASITATLGAGGGGRWEVAGGYAPGADGIDVTAQWTDNTDDASLDIPAITPGEDDTYRAVFVYTRTAGGATAITPPAGWTDLVDIQTTNGSGAKFGAYAAGVQLAGQSGVAQPTATGTYSPTNARNIGWQLLFSPAAVAPASGSSTGTLSWVGTATGERQSSGASTGSLLWAGSAAGSASHQGSSVGDLAWTGTAAGSRPSAGASSGTLAWSGTAAGSRPSAGSSDGALTWAGTAAGSRASLGASTGELLWAGTADGEAPAVGDAEGFSTGTLSWTGTATGSRPSAGASSGTLEWTGAAAGSRESAGESIGALSWDGTVEGDRPSVGASVGTLEWIGTASGAAPLDLDRTVVSITERPRVVSVRGVTRHVSSTARSRVITATEASR